MQAIEAAVNPILQFGTSRFLLAHADLFVSQAMARGQALGGITVVQSTGNVTSLERVAALNAGSGYSIRVRGLRAGQVVDETLTGIAVQQALNASTQWLQVIKAAMGAQVIISNTADAGYAVNEMDAAELLLTTAVAPRSFPAKLLVLLHARWRFAPAAPLSILPCELISRNGDTLRELVIELARQWRLTGAFELYLREHCIWGNSLVDRIVSEPLYPVGAVAEPYALWAIERQSGLVLPCAHEAIVLTDELQQFERLKLYLLNLGHTYLAERWLADKLPADLTVHQAMTTPSLRADIEAVWAEEVLPIFDATGEGQIARQYMVDLRDRLLNPFLVHRVAEIAENHLHKKQRRIAPVIALAEKHVPELTQHRLRRALD